MDRIVNPTSSTLFGIGVLIGILACGCAGKPSFDEMRSKQLTTCIERLKQRDDEIERLKAEIQELRANRP